MDIEIWPGEQVAMATILFGRVGDGDYLPRRQTFRIGLTDGTVTPAAMETVGHAWFDQRVRELSAELDSLLVCEPLSDGTELRLVPSRPVEGTSRPVYLDGAPFESALRRRNSSSGAEVEYFLWAPSRTYRGVYCDEKLIWTLDRSGPFLQCRHLLGVPCTPNCFEPDIDTRTWGCTGEAADGLIFCQPLD